MQLHSSIHLAALKGLQTAELVHTALNNIIIPESLHAPKESFEFLGMLMDKFLPRSFSGYFFLRKTRGRHLLHCYTKNISTGLS